MYLHDITDIIGDTALVRDAEFLSLGLITYNSQQLLVFIEHEKYLSRISTNPNVTAIITSEELAKKIPIHIGVITAPNPRKAFYSIHNHLATNTNFYWSDFDTVIDKSAIIHPKAFVANRNVHIGKGVVIEPNVNIMEHSVIGNNSIIRAGSVVGSPGFEFSRTPEGIFAVEHAGGVKIEKNVEIQANCSIDRSVFGGFTIIGEETKISNLVHVAHNVKIGKRCLIAACAMIAGSVTIGDDVWIGPSASVSSEVVINNGASVTIGSVVTRNVAENQKVTGNFAIEHEKFMSFLKSIR